MKNEAPTARVKPDDRERHASVRAPAPCMTRTMIRMTALLAASLLAAPLASAELLGPSAPTALAASATAPGEITLSWQAATSPLGISSYRVYHVESDGNLTQLAEVAPDQLSFVEAGIADGTTMTYVVRAVDLLGEGPASEPASATTWTVPDAPTDLAATSGPGALGEATLTWGAPASDGGAPVQAYVVYRDGALVAMVDGATLTWTDSGLTPFHAYAYEVSALNAVGEGAAAGTCGMASPAFPELGCASLL